MNVRSATARLMINEQQVSSKSSCIKNELIVSHRYLLADRQSWNHFSSLETPFQFHTTVKFFEPSLAAEPTVYQFIQFEYWQLATM
jgi:hypothetical protein